MKTAMFSPMIFSANGTNRSAMSRRTTRGSLAGSTSRKSRITSGGAVTRVLIASRKSSSFDGECRSTAAGVTLSSLAMSASVAASKPFVAKTRRAVSSSCSRDTLAGLPICK